MLCVTQCIAHRYESAWHEAHIGLFNVAKLILAVKLQTAWQTRSTAV